MILQIKSSRLAVTLNGMFKEEGRKGKKQLKKDKY
jgi:hypothetical protein